MNTSDPGPILVSIVTVIFNGIDTLEKLLRGTAQLLALHPDIEHVIVDGCSTDGSIELLNRYSSEHSRVMFCSERDEGIYDAMNKGVGMCHGKYFIHLNSDDEVMNVEKWKDAMVILRSDRPMVFSTDVPIVRDDLVLRYLPGRPLSELHRRFGHHFPHQGTFFDIELFNSIGGYSTAIGYVADKIFCYQIWDRISIDGVVFSDAPLAFQRSGGVSSRSALTPFRTIWLVLKSRRKTPHRNAYLRALLNPAFKVFMLYRPSRRREYQELIFQRPV